MSRLAVIPRFGVRRAIAAACVVALCGSVGIAQTGGSNTNGLRRVDQGYADRSAISTSFRTFGVDLRVPGDFQDLYQLPSQAGQPGQYVRKSGAVSAVFPRSVYVDQQERTLVAVPPGTVYYLGELPDRLGAEQPPSASVSSAQATGVDARAESNAVRTQLDTRPQAIEAPIEMPSQTVLTSESYRRVRISEIMGVALGSR